MVGHLERKDRTQHGKNKGPCSGNERPPRERKKKKTVDAAAFPPKIGARASAAAAIASIDDELIVFSL